MRIRKKKWAEPELSVCDFYVAEPEELRGKWKSRFKNDNPIMLEVGCGKGSFAGQLALAHPEINYIAVDIKLDMLGVGRRNIVKLFENSGREVDNLLLTRYNVEMLDKILSPDDHIARVYINFCNPWPRPKHNKRRLTYPKKLRMYRELLTGGDELHFKTDDDALFADTLGYLKEEGFNVKVITYDLHESDVDPAETPMTEHEKMFSDEGVRIKYLVAVKG